MKRKLKGFTLVELVITIAIVIILSVVSVPIYQGYTNKAKQSEGYALLGLILSAQKSYYSEYGNFFSGDGYDNYITSYDPVLGIDARGNKYFTKFRDSFSGYDIQYRFRAFVFKPLELIQNGKSEIKLDYNITSGATFIDYEN